MPPWASSPVGTHPPDPPSESDPESNEKASNGPLHPARHMAGAISPGLYAPVVLMSIATSMIAPGLLTRLFQRKARTGSKPEAA